MTQPMWVLDAATQRCADSACGTGEGPVERRRTVSRMVKRPVTYVPGLYKIFDEIMVRRNPRRQRRRSALERGAHRVAGRAARR